MTSKSSLSDTNRSTSTHSKTLATDSLRPVTDSELDLVAGGIHVTKLTDASSPNLFLNCASGTHTK
jgi:type VI protein secretion system component Hcp